MKKPARFRLSLPNAAAVFLFISAASVHAGFVAWSAPQQILGDSDIRTDGTLIVAHNLGSTGNASATINGVTFTPFATNAVVNTSGNVTISSAAIVKGSNDAFEDFVPPFTNLSPDYQALLRSASFTTGPSPAPSVTLTLAGLALGMDYQFQWWANQPATSNFDPDAPAPPGAPTTTATSGGSVALQRYSFLPDTLGQYAIGTFTATSPTQSIVFQGSDTMTLFNAFQLRQLPAVAIPEPGSGLFALALSAFSAGSISARRRPKHPTPRL